MSRSLVVATAQYPIDWLDSFAAYEEKIADWVVGAVDDGAELLVFPEYGAMELASLAGAEIAGDLAGSLNAVSGFLEESDRLHEVMARIHGVHILAATGPRRAKSGRITNEAKLFAPNGEIGVQPKQIMTPFESDWGVVGVPGLKVFDIGKAKIGISICYDIEFPLIARALAMAGAEVILAPSNTETKAGAWRVRTGARARALENQCWTVVSPTVGKADWSPVVDLNHGRAGIYGPPDRYFPESGILVEGEWDDPTWVIGELNLDLVRQVRAHGNVRTFRDWTQQQGLGDLPQVDVVEL
ncbi:MAG: amidohydrolase [Hyphomicrobiales bacterium]|nr:MAG: amidohydrolase [Hyphomicrobiales bacterium]